MADKKGFAYEHRMVMVTFLGRHLKPTEVVHHINGDRSDNRIENLSLTDHAAHGRQHAPHRIRDAKGRFCCASQT